MSYTALIAGGSGLVGSHVLQFLLKDKGCKEVISIGRRELNIKHKKLEQYEVDFNKLEEFKILFEVDKVFCCLGTTIKVAGSKEQFRKVDETYPLAMAKLAEQGLAKSFSIVTAMGADKKSAFFYNRVKGDVEESLKLLHIDQINIIKPSLLLGGRTEQRTGERIAQNLFRVINPALQGSLRKYKGITGKQVARAMVTIANDGPQGYHQYTNDMLLNY